MAGQGRAQARERSEKLGHSSKGRIKVACVDWGVGWCVCKGVGLGVCGTSLSFALTLAPLARSLLMRLRLPTEAAKKRGVQPHCCGKAKGGQWRGRPIRDFKRR